MERNLLAYYQRLSLGGGMLSGSFSFLFAYLYFLIFLNELILLFWYEKKYF